MKEGHIKPIPKYILVKVRKLDFKYRPDQKGPARFYSYLTKIKGELVKITVAVKTRYKKWWIKQVAVHGVNSKECLVRDMEYNRMGGLKVGWHAEGMYKDPWWYEDGKWYNAEFKYFNPWSILVNKEYVGTLQQFKYSAHQQFRGDCIIKYLRIYEKFPQAEYLVKFGLLNLYNKISILRLVGKDKAFCKWLVKNKSEIGYNYACVIIESYKTGKPMKQVQEFQQRKKSFERESHLQPLRDFVRKDLERFFCYVDAKGIGYSSYLDYMNACNYLGLDMTLVKNRFPHDFNRWHDIRIDQYKIAKAKADKKERAELYQQFATVANKYLALQNCKQGMYAVLIARSPAELYFEGEILNHCVGTMNYDKKMVREETLIFFVRRVDAIDVPFITIEYSVKSKKVLQTYGQKHERPDENVMTFVNKVWLPYANRTIKKLKEAA